MLLRCQGVGYEDDAVGDGADPEAGQYLAAKGALKWGVTELFQLVVLQEELHNAVAEGAEAVVEE